MATLSELRVGQTVSFNLRGDESGLTHGVVTSINRSEETANVNVWARLEDGGHSRTDRTLAVDVSRLRVIADFREDEKQVSQRVKQALQKKVDEHNEKHGDNPAKRATLRMLEAVFRRGVGAYRTNPQSVRGNVTSADMWAYARVNAFLYALRNLRFRGGKFDLDLLPRAHPLSSKKNIDDTEYKGLYDDLDFSIPKGAKEEARRGLEWRKEFGRGGTEVGIASARYISNTDTASPERVRKIAKYFPRHEVDKRAEGYRQGEDGYPSNGRIAWALWGGEAGKSWSQKLVRAMNKRDEEAKSALELIQRRNKLREESWDYRTNRFRSEKVKDILYKEHDKLLTQWEKVFQDTYFDLLQSQDLAIFNSLKDNMNEGLATFAIDENIKSWSADVFDLYVSLANDFAFYQVDLLMPNEKQSPLVIPHREKRSRNDIIEQGFFYRLISVDRFPLSKLTNNKEAIAYINERIEQVLPSMARTSKDRFNREFRKALQDGLDLGYSGRQLQRYVANNVKKVLSKKNLSRALLIARTETNAIANYGRGVGAKSTGIIYTKEWISQRDDRVRDAHVSLDGTEVNENDAFNYQGFRLEYPGDSSLGAPAGLTVNCRCFLSYHEKRI